MKQRIQRAQAVAEGRTRYFTGKPCPKGHIADRTTYNYNCVECIKDRQRTPASRKYHRGYSKLPKARDWRRNHRALNGGHVAPPPEKECPPRPENSRCQCCREVRELCLDHDHITGDFRGWICKSCNAGIGRLGDTLAGVEAAFKYMRRCASRQGRVR
jgi:hypothetical protein